MRIGLYGLPTAGKSYLLDSVRNFKVLSGSKLLLEIEPEFHMLSEEKKNEARKKLAQQLMSLDNFIMDGHYSFGKDVVFTEDDGQLYDAFLYLYIDPKILRMRMEDSERNKKYLQYDLSEWQNFEVQSLREYCHEHDKDFYVIDNPVMGYFSDISVVLQFIDSIAAGYSCVNTAKCIVDKILSSNKQEEVFLSDGDKTLIKEDSSGLVGYTTHIFDGNFYTGFQAWRHHHELTDYLRYKDSDCPSLENLNITYNEIVKNAIERGYILTTGYLGIWRQISDKLGVPIFYGNEMAAETKYYIVKYLQRTGKKVIAYGDGMNDYYMLKQADKGFLVCKQDGSVSRSLKGKDLEGIFIVRD